jgi:hypothetical protein
MRINCCCTEWEQEIILFLDNELSPQGHARVKKHIKKCAACAEFCRELEREEYLLSGAVRQEAESFLPADSFTDSVMKALPDSRPLDLGWKVVELVLSGSRFVWAQAVNHAAIAASLLICLIGTLVTLKMGYVKENPTLYITRNQTLYPCYVKEPILVTRPEGEFFEFPDGSLAYATKDTWFTIESYQEEKNNSNVGKDRQISLKFGELFLDVRPAKEGFTVSCANSKAKVFGTQFYVSANLGEYFVTTVAVREGQVMVEKQNLTGYTVIKAGEMTRIFGKNNRIALGLPETINSILLKKLIRFDSSLNDRSAQRLIPMNSLFDQENEIKTSDPFTPTSPNSAL